MANYNIVIKGLIEVDDELFNVGDGVVQYFDPETNELIEENKIEQIGEYEMVFVSKCVPKSY